MLDKDIPERGPAWLDRSIDEIRFSQKHNWADAADIKLAIMVLRGIEIDEIPQPDIQSEGQRGISLYWVRETETATRIIYIRIQNGQVFFHRYLNGRGVPIARGIIAKGRPATARELMKWMFGAAVIGNEEKHLKAEITEGEAEQ